MTQQFTCRKWHFSFIPEWQYALPLSFPYGPRGSVFSRFMFLEWECSFLGSQKAPISSSALSQAHPSQEKPNGSVLLLMLSSSLLKYQDQPRLLIPFTQHGSPAPSHEITHEHTVGSWNDRTRSPLYFYQFLHCLFTEIKTNKQIKNKHTRHKLKKDT